MSSTTGGRYNQYSQGSSGWSIVRNEEFQEHDIWGVHYQKKEEINSTNYSTFSRQQSTASAKMIPKSISSSSSSPTNEHKIFQQSSAPINIPADWQKIYSKASSNDFSWGGGGRGGDGDGDGDGFMNKSSWDSDDEDEDDERMIPPHEWISRKVARSQMCSFSVYEGVGRTLKGRDLSNVRNAVLTKTGFLE